MKGQHSIAPLTLSTALLIALFFGFALMQSETAAIAPVTEPYCSYNNEADGTTLDMSESFCGWS